MVFLEEYTILLNLTAETLRVGKTGLRNNNKVTQTLKYPGTKKVCLSDNFVVLM